MRRKTQELVEVLVYTAIFIGLGTGFAFLWALRYAEPEPVPSPIATYETTSDRFPWLEADPSPPQSVVISTRDCLPPNRWVSHRVRYGKSHTVQLDFCEVVEPDADR